MKTALVGLIVLAMLIVIGCANMSPREQRAATGALGGAALGAGVGAVTGGSAATGAVIGGAAGAAGGWFWDDIRHAWVRRR